jgi:cytochrome c-type biogenesis protein CcmH
MTRGVLLLAAALLASGDLRAQTGGTVVIDTALERRTRELASELRCPVCQGLSIADSPSELAQEMRAVVKDQLAAGKTPPEIKGYFVEKYGEWALLSPKPAGLNLLVYLLPLALVVGGGWFVWRFVRRHTAGSASVL